MTGNSSDNPATDGADTIVGGAVNDALTGGYGDDSVTGGVGDDLLRGDDGVTGTWFYETFDRDFSNSAGQAFDIESGTQTGAGYVSDFDEGRLTNTIRGTGNNPEDFGVIYTSTLNVDAGGTYTFSTRSDDGSTIQIFDSAGNALIFDNQSGGLRPYMNNDFHQGATTRSGTVELDPNTTYTIQIRYWENRGGDVLEANVSGPDTGGSAENLLTTDMLGAPPGPDFSTTGVPFGAPGDDTLIGGGGNDQLFGDAGDDVLYGDNAGTSGGGAAPWTFRYYDLPGTGYSTLAQAGFTANGGRDNTNPVTASGQAASFDPGDYDSGDHFALKFSTDLTVAAGGTYTFTTSSDDGSKVFVNGVEVVDNDGLQSTNTESGTVNLGPGTHTVEIIYFENSGFQTLSASIAGPDTGGAAADLATYGALVAAPDAGADTLDGGLGDDALFGEEGRDSLTGGAGDDSLTGGLGQDTLTGGAGDDLFIYGAGDGADTITDFGVGASGGLTDGDTANNDRIDLSDFYNETTRAAVNAAGGDFADPLRMLRADAADGRLDGIIGGVDYSTQIGAIDLVLQDGAGGTVGAQDLTPDTTFVTCFCAGTRIDTPDGPRPVQDLRPGDLVSTADHGAVPLRLNLTRHVAGALLAARPELRPVRIPQGALGKGLPARDLWVSRQHRMLVRSPVAVRMFGGAEVLVAAIRLVGHRGVAVDDSLAEVRYHHLVFDRHQVVFADGAPSESFFPGPQAMRTLPADARAEFARLFPGVDLSGLEAAFARPVPDGRRQKTLLARLRRNRKPVLDAA